MATDPVKKPGTIKNMTSVIAQLENKGRGNAGLRPTPSGAQKPAPQIGVKPSSLAAAKGNLRKSVSEKEDDCPSTPAAKQTEEANPFKVALKPVKPSTAGKPSINEAEKTVKPPIGISKPEMPGSGESSVSNKSKLFEKPTVKAEPGAKDGGDSDGSASSSSLVSNRSKMFENSQRKSEAGSPNISSNNEPSFKSKPYDNATLPKANVAPKPISKSPFITGTTQNSGNVASTLPDRGKKGGYGKSDEKENAHTTQNSSAQETPKPKGKSFMSELESKVSLQHPGNSQERPSPSGSLPKKPKEFLQIPHTTNNADAKEENQEEEEEEETEKPRVPSRALGKVEKQNTTTKTVSVTSTADSDQPKIPPRKDQKAPETKTASPKPSNAINQKPSQTSQSKNQDKLNQNTNKTATDNLQSLLRNKDRPVPVQSKQKENQKKYRLLPVPKPSGNPPRKLAKPPMVDLSKYAKSKGLAIQKPAQSSSSVAPSYDDGDDIYEDCDDLPSQQQTSRISEYTEEEEAEELQKMAKAKLGQATDNYGKMFNNNPQDYEDDDEIYQEID